MHIFSRICLIIPGIKIFSWNTTDESSTLSNYCSTVSININSIFQCKNSNINIISVYQTAEIQYTAARYIETIANNCAICESNSSAISAGSNCESSFTRTCINSGSMEVYRDSVIRRIANIKRITVESEHIIVCPGSYRFPEQKGWKFSVLALTDRVAGLTIRGAKYEVTDAELTNAFPLGVGNDFDGDITLRFLSGTAAVLLCDRGD